jgi:hypothetical protein
MIPLDQYEKWLPRMDESAELYLKDRELKEFYSIPEDDRKHQLYMLLTRPINVFTIINEIYFRARWGEILKILHPAGDLKLLEIASGDADMIPQVMACTHPNSTYITANMNKLLNESLLEKIKELPLVAEIIEDDAVYIQGHLGQEVIDVIAFQHSINDVLQAILCDREGVDTIYSDWMETLPRMIEILKKEVSQNTLELSTKTPFLGLMNVLLEVLKKDGIIAMNHYMFQLDLDWGYPSDLFKDMIPITREWMKELKNCKEIFFDGFDSNWWIFLQKL